METKRGSVVGVKLAAVLIAVVVVLGGSIGIFIFGAPANVNRFYGGGLSLAAGGEGFSIGADAVLSRSAANTWSLGAGDSLIGATWLNSTNIAATHYYWPNGTEVTNGGATVNGTAIAPTSVTGATWVNSTNISASSLYINSNQYYPEEEASYTVWVDGATYYARNGHTGAITSNANAATLINACISALSAGRTQQEKVLLKGNFTTTATITIPGYTEVELQGKIMCAAASTHSIYSLSGNYIYIHGGIIDGNKANCPAGTYGVTTTATAYYCLIEDVKITNTQSHSFYIQLHQGNIINCFVTGNAAGYAYNLHESAEVSLTNCIAYLPYQGIYISDSNGIILKGCQFLGAQQRGAYIVIGTKQIIIDSCSFRDNSIESADTYAGLEIHGNNITVVNCQALNFSGAFHQKYGILIGNDATDVLVAYCNLSPNDSAGFSDAGGTRIYVRQCLGYIVENTVTATIASGATSATIAHGLSYTPTSANTAWTVTYLENPTDDPGPHYITGMNATHVIINVLRDPGASNLDISWSAQRVP